MNANDKFQAWFHKWQEHQMGEFIKSYYDSDTGLIDMEAARHDELRQAFEAGQLAMVDSAIEVAQKSSQASSALKDFAQTLDTFAHVVTEK